MFAIPALAVVEANFDRNVPINQIQYYWANDNTSATQNGRVINADPSVSFNLSDANLQAKAKSTPPANVYVFGGDPAFPLSATIYIRLWNGTALQDGAFYTGLLSGSNPTGSLGTPIPVASSYLYVKATPAQAVITQYSEVGTTLVIAPFTVTKQVTFSSTSPQVSGKTVEIGSSIWTLTQNGTALTPITVSGTNLTLDTNSLPSGLTMNSGDKIALTVKHVNLWGVAGTASTSFTYTVGAGGGTGGPGGGTSATFNLAAGINTISLPCAPTKTVTVQVGANSGVINATDSAPLTIGQLIKTINAQAGSNVVTVVGLFDATNQQHVGLANIQYTSAGDIDTTKGTAIGNLTPTTKYTVSQIAGLTRAKGQALQLTVGSAITLVISGQ
jgi:hypothetical protein